MNENQTSILLYARVNDGVVTNLLNTIFDAERIVATDVLIGEGVGDAYAHPQTVYQLMTDDGIYRYQLADDAMVLRTDEAMQAERDARQVAGLSTEIRATRTQLLTACDWTQIADAPLNEVEKTAWATYRQALRDVPQQAGFPADVVWPVAPMTI